MNRRAPKPRLKQPMPDELLASLLAFVESKFYQGHPVAFAKDRPRLLAWVIFEPARWLKERAVTISTQRYGEILRGILMEAAAHGDLEAVRYLPAWLRQTIQSHLRMHGDEIYAEAKSMRNLVENAKVLLGNLPAAKPEPDVVREFTAAKRLLNVAKGQKRGGKRAVNDQLILI